MSENKKIYISALSVLSCIAVVFLHANDAFWHFSYDRYWITSNIIECVLYFAVPVFFMISGATLMDYRDRYTTAQYFKKRITKTVVPYLFWSLAAILITVARGQASFEDFSLLSFAEAVINHKYINIFWFFPALYIVYLCIPVLSLIPKQMRKRAFMYITAAYFIFDSVLPTLITLCGLELYIQLSMPLGADYIVFVLIGYCIDRYPVKRKYRFAIYAFGLLGLVLHVFGTQFLSYAAGDIVKTFKGYTNFPSIMYSTAIFMFFRQLSFEKFPKFIINTIEFFSPVTFGVYLVHWFVLELFIMFTGADIYSIVFRVLGGAAVFLISALTVKLFKKLPLINRILP